MEIENLLKKIQDSCNDFITQNLETVLKQLEENKVTIDTNFSNIKIENIEKKSWGCLCFLY